VEALIARQRGADAEDGLLAGSGMAEAPDS
jgi:hypothetical protein